MLPDVTPSWTKSWSYHIWSDLTKKNQDSKLKKNHIWSDLSVTSWLFWIVVDPFDFGAALRSCLVLLASYSDSIYCERLIWMLNGVNLGSGMIPKVHRSGVCVTSTHFYVRNCRNCSAAF